MASQPQDDIDRVTSLRSSSEGAPFNLPPSVIVHPPRDDGNHDPLGASEPQIGQRRRPLPSYASTLYDRGDSERLRDSIEDTPRHQDEQPENTISGAGTWSELIQPDTAQDQPDIAQKLRDAFVESADGKEFLPLDALETIVTEKVVQQLLDKAFPDNPPSALDICQRQEFQDHDGRTQYTSRQKIFATLALIDKVHLISDFLEEKISDTNLPLKERKTPGSTFLIPRDLENDPHSGYALQTAKRWTRNEIALFHDQQWVVSAPYFARAENLGEKVHFYSLSPHDIMPFVKPGTDDRGNPASLYAGFFSTIRREHNGADFAVKKITRVYDVSAENHKQCFDQEVEALKRFCQKNERYIIKLLATYEISGEYHLLFPVADGNLMDLWKDSLLSQPGASLWLAQECLGIAQALQKIHKYTYTPPQNALLSSMAKSYHGIHGDIKPQNVLWFKTLPSHLQSASDSPNTEHAPALAGIPDLGYLQLSDFGTVHFHRDTSRLGNEILVKGNSYRAPETDLQGNQGSAAIDIWAFGCLYLDFITCLLRGYKAVDEDFSDVRTMDEPMPKSEDIPRQDKFFIAKKSWFTGRVFHIVKPGVTEWIGQLHREPQCTQFLHEFLDFIETRMLVVSLENRCECAAVVEKLNYLLVKCVESRDYRELGSPHIWTSFKFSHLLIKRKIQKLSRIVNSNGQMVAAIFILIIVVAFILIRVPDVYDFEVSGTL
ncbi:kinase-like domain-containing protein [Xylariaceae sp. FL1651]|nr:kinase-like domain-containing protein [Xylariaceae sp. FL1651]